MPPEAFPGYSDRVLLEEYIVEVAYRDGSLEVNEYSSSVEGYRVNIGGCWAIVSSQGVGRLDPGRVLQLARRLVSRSSCEGLSEAQLFTGQVVVGNDYFDAESLAEEVPPKCLEAKRAGASTCEAMVVYRRARRVIERSDGGVAEEVKHTVKAEAAVVVGGRLLAEDSFSIVWSKGEALDQLGRVFEKLLEKIPLSMKARKPLIPVGAVNMVLDYDVAAALMHEVSHTAEPSLAPRDVLGKTIASSELTIYDDPLNKLSPSLRFFDDEGVAVEKRVILENGRLVDMHHTRSTAYRYGSRPGSAYGLFHKPVGFHTTLVVEPGDWREEEIVEETRHGLYVEGVVMAVTEKGYVRIVPETVYTIKDGEIVDLVAVKAVKIPLRKLHSVYARTKTRRLRVSQERDWIVAEYSPRLALEAYIEYP